MLLSLVSLLRDVVVAVAVVVGCVVDVAGVRVVVAVCVVV